MSVLPAAVSSFNRKRHPYYIFGSDFRDTSAGVTALHYLCHALNCAGEAAFVLNTNASKAGLNVRFLDVVDYRHHYVSRMVPIMVYPEIVSGNPYRAQAVVRYMLNHEGLLTGRKVNPGERDLTFYHSPEFIPEGVTAPEVLQVPVCNDELFAPRFAGPRKHSYLYLGRVRRDEVDFSQLPADIQVLDIHRPRSLQELADLFQTASVLYSYEISGTCACAMLAGCPVLYVRNPNLQTHPDQATFSTDGSAFTDEEGGLERARATVARVRERWQKIKDGFPPQLAHFIHKTQELAESFETNDHTAASMMLQIFPKVQAG